MNKQSRFFMESSSDEEDNKKNDSSEDEAAAQKQTARTTGTYKMSDSSSDEGSVQRVVKNRHDRAWDTIRDIVSKVRNSMNTKNWSAVEDAWKECNKKMETSKKDVLAKGIPPFYIRMLVDVEDAVNALNKEQLRALKPAIGKAAASLKTASKKHNVAYATDMAACRADPSKYESASEEEEADEDEESDSDSADSDEEDSDEDSDDAKVDKKGAGDSDSDDSYVSETDSSDSDNDYQNRSSAAAAGSSAAGGRKVLAGRARWLKSDKVKEVAHAARLDTQAARVLKQQAQQGGVTVKPNQTAKTQKVEDKNAVRVPDTEEELQKRLHELMASRGRKGTDPREVLRKLEVLARGSRKFGPRVEIPVLMHLVSSMYDGARGIDDYMEVQPWRTCYRCLLRITNILNSNKKLSLVLMSAEDATDLFASKLSLMKKEEEEAVAPNVDPNVIRVVGSLGAFIQRLEDEYTKALQQINPHTSEYVARLSDEAALIELADIIFKYYTRVNDTQTASNVALMHVEHIYYKHDIMAQAVNRAHVFNKKWGRFADIHPSCTSKLTVLSEKQRDVTKVHPATFSGYPVVEVPPTNPTAKIAELSQYIFKHGDERLKTRALLCSVFHHALHDRFYRAKDLFLISHIQDVIEKADVKTQILYNRVLASLGLCAFREGLILKAHECLQHICGNRFKIGLRPLMVRELLAQGTARRAENDPEQERMERRRQIPYHMHINPDLLDSCYLTCAMLLYLPYLARGNVAPKHERLEQFGKQMQSYNKQVFTGPPENTKEHIMAAAKCMVSGDWQKASHYILDMDVWKLIPNDGGAKVKAMLSVKLKEEAVRTYLLSNGVSAYSSISLSHLCATFDTQPEPTRRIVSKMIFNKEISAAWEADNTLVLHQVDPSTTQSLAVKVAAKVSELVDANERLLDPLNGGHMFRDEWPNRWQDNSRGDNRDYGNRKFGPNRGGAGRGGNDFQHGGQRRDNRDGGDRGGYRNNRGNQNQRDDRGNQNRRDNKGGYANKASGGQRADAGADGASKSAWGKPGAASAVNAWGTGK